MCSRKRLTFIKDFINNESVCHFMVVQLYTHIYVCVCVWCVCNITKYMPPVKLSKMVFLNF